MPLEPKSGSTLGRNSRAGPHVALPRDDLGSGIETPARTLPATTNQPVLTSGRETDRSLVMAHGLLCRKGASPALPPRPEPRRRGKEKALPRLTGTRIKSWA